MSVGVSSPLSMENFRTTAAAITASCFESKVAASVVFVVSRLTVSSYRLSCLLVTRVSGVEGDGVVDRVAPPPSGSVD